MTTVLTIALVLVTFGAGFVIYKLFRAYTKAADDAGFAHTQASNLAGKNLQLSNERDTLASAVNAKDAELAREQAARRQVEELSNAFARHLKTCRDPTAIDASLRLELERLQALSGS